MTPLDLALMFLDKGKEDEEVLRELAGSRNIADDIFGLHVQQAIEKYLKALLGLGEARPPRTHLLQVLLREVEATGAKPPVSAEELEPWSVYAVRNRYPLHEDLPPLNRSAALRLVEKVRGWAEEQLQRGQTS